MPLKYKIEGGDPSFSVRIEEEGAPRRILYLDTLKGLAQEADREGIALLTKIHLRSPNVSRASDTVSFQQITVSSEQLFEVIRCLSKTGRVFWDRTAIQYDGEGGAKLYWKGERGGPLAAAIQWKGEEIPLELCEKVFPQWCMRKGIAFSYTTQVGWKWVSLFLKGGIALTGSGLKRFLDEEPPILWKEPLLAKPLEVFPELHLTDATGCFANLQMEYPGVGRVAFEDFNPAVGGKGRLKGAELGWEKDLIEAGYQRKAVGNSRYYCSGDRTRETLLLLIGIGWKVFDARGRRILKQTDVEWNVREEAGAIAIRGRALFDERSVPLKAAMTARGLWCEIDAQTVGILDVRPIDGEWKEDALIVPRSAAGSLAPLLNAKSVDWDKSILSVVEGLKMGAALEPAAPGPSFRGTLLPYQQKGVDWLSFLHQWGFSALLADEMGLGKTVQVLAFFSRLRTNLPSLIVAPSSLLYQWRFELSRFLPDVPVSIYDRDVPAQGIVIVSYAMLRLDGEILSQTEFEVIVLDESNAIKTASAQTARAACRLTGRFKIALTGTPVENRPDELVSQFRFLMPDLLGGKPHLQLLKDKIRPFFLRRKKQEVEIELPEKIEQIAWIEMSDAQARVYESFKSRTHPQDLTNRMEILEAILRLRQICSDPRLVGSDVIGTKIELLLQDVEGKKALIFSQFTSMLSLIGKALQDEGRDFLYIDGSTPPQERAEQVRRFQEGECDLFLLSLKAGGIGLNLTAADYVLLFDPWWNEAVERQAIDRAHRIGQTKTVIAKRYITPNSIEEKMLRLKEEKTEMAELLIEGDAFSWTEEDLLRLLT